MSKKIDIEQLIENKFSKPEIGDKSSFLTLEALMKEIDTVLENIAGSGAEQVYGRKAGLPDNLPEADDYVNVAQDNPALTSGHGVERASAEGHSEGGYKQNVGQPDLLPEKNTSPSNLSIQSMDIPLPDLMSIVSSKRRSDIGSDDRELINSVIANAVGTGTWKEKITNLNNYFAKLKPAIPVETGDKVPPREKASDKIYTAKYGENRFQKLISNLMTLELLQQLFEMGPQHRTLFNELVMAPIFGKKCVAAADTGLADITCGSGAEEFSLKFFSGPDMKMEGSYANLVAATEMKYVITRIVPEKTGYVGLDFWEVLVASEEKALELVKDKKTKPFKKTVETTAAYRDDLERLIIKNPGGKKFSFKVSALLGPPDMRLFFPDPKVLQQNKLILAQILQSNISNILFAFKNLNINLVKFLAVKRDRKVSAVECKKNAKDIINGIEGIEK